MNRNDMKTKAEKLVMRIKKGRNFRSALTILLCAIMLFMIPTCKASAEQAGNVSAVAGTVQTDVQAEKFPLPVRIGCAAILSLLVGLPISYVLVRSLTRPKKIKSEELKSTRFSSISLPSVKSEKVEDVDVFVPTIDRLDQPKE